MRKLLQLTIFISFFSVSNILAQSANFTYASTPANTPYCEGVTVIFSDASVGATSWDWNFGPGAVPATSTSQGPIIVSFPVCNPALQVTLVINGGGAPILTKTKPVPIYCDPHACFIVNTPAACAGTQFSFNSSCSTVGAGSSSLSYIWDMCNGQQLNSANPSYTYPEDSGCFCATLVITNNHGCNDDTSIANAVCITPPPSFTISALGITTTCLNNLTVDFCAPPVVNGAPPYTYSWTFQGGTPGTSALPCPTGIVYGPGSWDVTCVVTDQNGCTSTEFVPNMINVGNSSTSIILSDTNLCVGECVHASTGPSTSYTWNISPTTCVTPNTTQNTAAVDYCFSCPGTYSISLSAIVNGCAVVAPPRTIHVYAKPVACINLTSNAPACSYPQTVNVQYCGAAGPWTYNWQFPGGTPSSSTLQNPGNITYNACGHYGISLTVTGLGGCDSSVFLNDTVKIDCPHACYTITNLPIAGKYCAPLSLNFNAGCSTGSPTQYLWCVQEVGAPPCIANQNLGPTPTLNFPTAGCYNVKLKIVNALGCKDSVTNYFPGIPICVGEHTTPCFSATPLTTCAPVPVVFTNCTIDTCGNPACPNGICFKPCQAWCWNFGDGPGCQDFNPCPSHLYQDTGCFDVMLISKNCGCNDTLTKIKYVCILPPIPKLEFTVNCDSPNVVYYDGTGSVGADVYIWTFVGGTPSTSSNGLVTVVYPMPNPNASYLAKLKICNIASGCCDSVSVIVFLRNLQPDATIDTIVCFPNTSHVVNHTIGASNYAWKIYDSCNGGVYLPALFSTSPVWFPSDSSIHFPGPGKYHVKLKVFALNGCVDSLEWDVVVRGVNPGFFGDVLSGCAPFVVTFTDTTNANCVSTPTLYSFNFGDAPGFTPPSTNPVVTHNYTTNGTFTVTEKVTDQYGCVSIDSTVAYVNAQVPVVNFYVPDTTICLGFEACFINTSTGLLLTYVWDFGDGDSSILAFPCHTYQSAGTYTVSLTCIDSNGCSSTLTKINYIIVGQVSVDFYATSLGTNCPPLEDTFFVSPLIPNGCGKYYWSFGDGTHSSIENPFHIYLYSGSFTVGLIATDTCLGCSTIVVKPNYINIGGPFANPSATPDTTCLPQLISFDLNPTNSVSFFWSFGDGSPLYGGTGLIYSAASHTYAMPDTGVFYPTVVLSDGINCTYSRIVDTLVLVHPIAKFNSSTNDLCSNGTVTFTDNSWSFGGNDFSGVPINHIVSWQWDFGGQGTSNLQNPPPVSFNTFGDFIVSLVITSVGGCTDTARDTIHVTEAPAAIPVPPVNALCFGDSTNFVADTSGSSTVCNVLWDFGDGTTSTLFNPAHLYLNPGTYSISFIVYGCNGCNDSAATSITISPPPIADAGPNVIICSDSSTILNGTGGTGFLWSTGETTVSITVTPILNSTYYLTVTDAAGCTGKDSVTVTITPPPTASITAGDSICPGSSITLTASGGSTYHWNTGETTAAITVTPNIADTTLIFTVTAFVGTCGDDTSATIVVLPFPSVDAGDSAEFCFGLSTQLNGTSNANIYLWKPSNSLNDSTIFNPIASPTVTTTYTLIVTDANGCTNSDIVVISVRPLPVVDAGPDRKICSETYTQLNVTGAIFYSWSPSNGLLNTSISNPICGGPGFDTTIYTVTGTDVYGCQGIDSIKVFVLFPFTVTYPNDTCFCIGETAELCAISSTQSTFKWKPIIGLDSSTNSCVTATPLTATTYTIYVSDSLGCYADTGDVEVCIYPLPVVVAGPDQTILVGTTAQLSGYNSLTPGTGNFQWLPDSTLTCYGCENPIANPLQTTIYIVTLTDLNGCKDEDTTKVNVYCNDNVLFVPNAFTPNGDGKNDEFHLNGVGITELHFLKIYNRWGQLVFQTTDFNATWDGKINGKKSEPEVFDYFLEAVCSTGELIRKQGNITLIR